MALVNCPECGRENVSDSAESCPNCGYGVKAHFEKIKQEEERKERLRRLEEEKRNAEAEEQKRQEERMRSVPQLQRPQLMAPIVTFVVTALFFLFGALLLGVSEQEAEKNIEAGNGDPQLYGVLFIYLGIGICVYGIYLLYKRIERYHLSKTDFEEYQRQVIKEQDTVIVAAQAAAEAEAREEALKPECPYCHSHDTIKISTSEKVVNTAMFGIFGQKRRYQWHCNMCKSDF